MGSGANFAFKIMEVGHMRWGIIRLVIVGSAFAFGMLVAGYRSSRVFAGGPSAANLSSTAGTSLVVTCDAGAPAVEHVAGISGAVQVKCEKSHMHVTRFPLVRPGSESPVRVAPLAPIAAIRRNLMILRATKASS
jgi:hypothetical protein